MFKKSVGSLEISWTKSIHSVNLGNQLSILDFKKNIIYTSESFIITSNIKE